VTVLAAARVDARPDTLESDVKAAVQKVASDEVDAALVYRTDVRAAGDQVEGIEFPESAKAVNRYPLAVLTESRNPTTAQAFVDHVLSADGRRVLSEAGFGPP
jgi:molybdate transport system substrate-binding protein